MSKTTHVQVFRDHHVMYAAELAVKHRLYVAGWDLSMIYGAMREGRVHPRDCIALTFVDDVPVASAVYRAGRGDINTFCRKALRRRGYATQAVAALKTALPDVAVFTIHQGAKHSVDFYTALTAKTHIRLRY